MTLIRKIYLYLFSLVGLVLVIIGCVNLVNLALKAYVFTAADQYYSYPVAPAPADKSATTTVPATPSDAQVKAYQDMQTKSSRESTAANALAMIIVGIPLYYYHWRVIQKDKEKNAQS
jgi:predicted cobalt transporter CbtA